MFGPGISPSLGRDTLLGLMRTVMMNSSKSATTIGYHIWMVKGYDDNAPVLNQVITGGTLFDNLVTDLNNTNNINTKVNTINWTNLATSIANILSISWTDLASTIFKIVTMFNLSTAKLQRFALMLTDLDGAVKTNIMRVIKSISDKWLVP